MNCEQAEQLMVDYLYGEISPEDRKAFDEHLQGCPGHAREVEKLTGMLNLVREQKPEEVPDQLSQRILHLARAEVDQQVRTSRAPWYKFLTSPVAAAAILVGVVLTVGLAVTQLSSDHRETSSLTHPSTEPVMAPSMGLEARHAEDQKPADEFREAQTAGKTRPAEPVVGEALSVKRPAAVKADKEVAHKGAPKKEYKRRSKRRSKPKVAATRKRTERLMKPRAATGAKKKAAQPAPGRAPDSIDYELDGAQKAKVAEEKSLGTVGGAVDVDDAKAGAASGPAKMEGGADKPRFAAPPPAAKKLSPPAPAPTVAQPSMAPAEDMADEMALQEEVDLAGTANGAESEDPRAVSKPGKRSVARKDRGASSQKLDLYQQAEGQLSEKNYPKALKAFRRFLSRRPGDARARTCRYRIAKTLFLMGRCQEAIRATQQAIGASARHGMAPAALLDQASCHIRLNQFDKARKVYRQIEKDYPAYQQDARQGLRRIEGR